MATANSGSVGRGGDTCTPTLRDSDIAEHLNSAMRAIDNANAVVTRQSFLVRDVPIMQMSLHLAAEQIRHALHLLEQ